MVCKPGCFLRQILSWKKVIIPQFMTIRTSRCVSLCASRLWIWLAMELKTSCRSAPSASTSSSHWRGSTTLGSWVTCSKDSSSRFCYENRRKSDTTDRSGDKLSRQSECAMNTKHLRRLETFYILPGSTRACKTNDHVDGFERFAGGGHMSRKQGMHPSTQEERFSPLWFISQKSLAIKSWWATCCSWNSATLVSSMLF